MNIDRVKSCTTADASVNQLLCMSEVDAQESERDVHLPTLLLLLLLLLLLQTFDDAGQILEHSSPMTGQGIPAVLLLLPYSQV